MIVELEANRPAELTGMRFHELALQQWLNSNFHVLAGYPVPVVISTPMDAFSNFRNLWSDVATNPFRYLLDAKDGNGTPLYEPYPSPPRYPLFSVYRKGWKYRVEQNYSYHKWRNLSWLTTLTPNASRQDLASAATAFMPMAWNYSFQVDFFCLRPDTLAMFVSHFMRKLYRTGGIPQTWVMVAYPFYGKMLARMTLDGEINYMTPEQPEDLSNVEYRASINLTIEGWEPDLNIVEVPVLWKLVLNAQAPTTVDPAVLQTIYTQTSELRDPDQPLANPNMNLRTNVPDYAE